MGFLAGGYKAPEVLAEQIQAVRAASVPFGVNLFVPNPVPISQAEFDRYARLIGPEAERYGVDLPTMAPIDDDAWTAKIDLILSEPVPIVGFTFAIPGRPVIDALHRAGITLVQTVTSVEEAQQAAASGVDLLAVQSFQAGGHWGTFTPQQPPRLIPITELVARVRQAVPLPLLAAGGIASRAGVAAVLRAGAAAALVGTVLLRTDESGASPPYQAALGARGGDTIVTKAFTGRPARALPNRFTSRYDAGAPFGYPAIHHLTSPIRRAATAAGDAECINLWAGTGCQEARPGPTADVLNRLAEGA
jgi:NAD(P)H-dependent flavin oxidoreductase YrpB (nitropropane dioxygenase family)